MQIKYVGNRPVVSIMCSGRVNYIFHKDNDFTQEINDPQHVSQILRSVQHKFETFDRSPVKHKAPVVEHAAIAEPHETVVHAKAPKPDKTSKPKKLKQLKVSNGG